MMDLVERDESRPAAGGQVLRDSTVDARCRHEFAAVCQPLQIAEDLPDGVSKGRTELRKSKSFTVLVHEGGVAVFMNF